MARSEYIYLVKLKGSDLVVAAFTVKYQSQAWAEDSAYPLDNLERTRMRDGGPSKWLTQKTQVPCPWE